MAPRKTKQTSYERELLLEWQRLLDGRLEDTWKLLRDHKRAKYPSRLWRSTGFRPPHYEDGWTPATQVPQRLSIAEAEEYVLSQARATATQGTPGCSRARHHRQGKKECQNLLNINAFRIFENRRAPGRNSNGVGTPKEERAKYKKAKRSLLQQEAIILHYLSLLAGLRDTDPPNQLPRQKDEDNDDDDEAGKGQGAANTSMPLLPQATAV